MKFELESDTKHQEVSKMVKGTFFRGKADKNLYFKAEGERVVDLSSGTIYTEEHFSEGTREVITCKITITP